MTIFTRFGSPVKFTEAKQRTLYRYTNKRGDMTTALRKPAPNLVKRHTEVEELPDIWFVKAVYTRRDPDDDGFGGPRTVGNGSWLQAGTEFRADGGWGEIEDAAKAAPRFRPPIDTIVEV